MRRTAAAACVTLLLLLTAPAALADERAPSPRDRFAKIVKLIKKLFTPAPQEDYPVPPKP